MRGTRTHAARTALVFIAVMLAGLPLPGGHESRMCGTGGTRPEIFAAELPEGVKNFYEIQKYYTKWHEGLFGSRHYHEGKLKELLRKLIGKEITTENDYMLASPEGIVEKKMVCIFPSYHWLSIHGDLDAESLRNIPGTDYEAMKGWWRSGMLVSVTGKLKNFKLDWDAQGDTVHLYFEKVTIISDTEKK